MPRRPRNRPIADVYQRFMRAMVSSPDLRLLTVKGYVQCEPLVALAFGDATAADMSRELVTLAQANLFAAGYKASTVKRRLGQMKTAWRWAIDEGLVYRPWCAPAGRRGVKRKQELHTKKRPYSVAELYRLLLAIDDPWRAPVRLVAEVGCRVSEACAANVADLRPDDAGRPWWNIPDSKTGAARRVPLTLDTYRAILGTLGVRQSGPLFLSYRGDRRMTTSAIKHAVSKVLDRLSGPGGKAPMRRVVYEGPRGKVFDLDVHGLRRSWIHHARLADVPRVVRMHITGHEQAGAHDGYSRNAVLDHEAVSAVEVTRAWRRQQTKVFDSTHRNAYTPTVGERKALRRWTPQQAAEPAVTPVVADRERRIELIARALFGGDPE